MNQIQWTVVILGLAAAGCRAPGPSWGPMPTVEPPSGLLEIRILAKGIE